MLDIEPVSGTVLVGSRERLAVDGLVGDQAPLVRRRTVCAARAARCSCAPTATSTVPWCASATTASRSTLLDPAYGIAPGQAVVIYDGTRVVGSATISAPRRAGSGELRRFWPAKPTAAHRCSAAPGRRCPLSVRPSNRQQRTAPGARDLATGSARIPATTSATSTRRSGSCSARCPTSSTCPRCPAAASRRDDRPCAGRGLRDRGGPAAGRLAADRRAGHRPPTRPQPAGPGPRRVRGADAGLPRQGQGPGGRPVDPGGDGRAAARGQGPGRPRRAPGPRAGPRRGTARPRGRRTPAGARMPRGSSSRSTSPPWRR